MPYTIFFSSIVDVASRMAAKFSKRLELEFISAGWFVEDCYGLWCLEEKTHVLHYTGHGEPDGWIVGGRLARPRVRARIVLSLACHSAKEFGEELAARGTAFVGFDDEFLFIAPKRCRYEECDPEKITVTRLAFEPWREMVRLLLAGWPVSLAVEAARRLYEILAEKVVEGEIDVPEDVREYLAATLLHNAKHLTFKGPDARVGTMYGTYFLKLLPAILPLFAQLCRRR